MTISINQQQHKTNIFKMKRLFWMRPDDRISLRLNNNKKYRICSFLSKFELFFKLTKHSVHSRKLLDDEIAHFIHLFRSLFFTENFVLHCFGVIGSRSRSLTLSVSLAVNLNYQLDGLMISRFPVSTTVNLVTIKQQTNNAKCGYLVLFLEICRWTYHS